jgi:hypothetical protein
MARDLVAPDHLDDHGRRAFAIAAEQVDALPDPDRFYDACLRFAQAVMMTAKIRREWVKAGEPLTYTHHNGALVPHPLVKMLTESERDAARAGRALKLEPDALKAPRGRRPGDNLAPDRQPPPVIKLSTKRPTS